MSKKIHLVAIGSALAVGSTVLMLLPSANAAGETSQEIMSICNKAEKINGVEQPLHDFGDNHRANTCDFVETKFETFSGPVQKASVDFPNCEPNSTAPAKVSVAWSASAAQGQGKSTLTQQGGGGGLFGVLNFVWQSHRATLDLTTKTAIIRETETYQVPPGKILYVQFTPKMQRMTGDWKVFIKERKQSFAQLARPEIHLKTEEVIEGPLVLPSAAGGPGLLDGESKPVFTDC